VRHRPWAPGAPSGPVAIVRPRVSLSWASVERLAGPIFVMVLASLLIGVATGLVRSPPGSPSPAATSPAVAHVLAYAVGWLGPDEDPPIPLASGRAVKTSNYRGVAVDGVTYFYNLAPRPSYDPLARGELTAQQIRIVAIVGDPPNRVTIYVAR